MKKPKKPEQFIRRTTYPGGKKALDEFVKTNLRYPKDALEKKLSGTVKIKFNIDHKGKTSNPIIEHGIGSGCDEEAIRLIKLLKFHPVKHRGVKVMFHKTLDIHFRLPVLQNKLQINYVLSKSPAKTEQQKKQNSITINYTIKKS